MSGPLVVIGAGQAGFQLADSLRQAGFAEPIFLIGEEEHAPYHRPPLSKAFLKEAKTADSLFVRPQAYLTANRIELILGLRATAIDRPEKRVRLAGGQQVAYDRLVLATGVRNRQMDVPGAALAGVVNLRTIVDATHLRDQLVGAEHVVIIGAGFIGLEVAAVVRGQGVHITVVEAADRPMQRAVGPQTSAFFRRAHESAEVSFRFGASVVRLHGEEGRVRSVELDDGDKLHADVVLVAIGVVANSELAAEAGLAVAGGIVVDAFLGTADPHISAIGDCALHPNSFAPHPVRIESVQNAVDQARALAARLGGRADRPYHAVPWFWSDQGALKLQIAGLGHGIDRRVLRGDPEAGAFSVFGFADDRLVSVESVMRAADHMAARKLLLEAIPISPAEAADPAFDLRSLVAARGRAG